MIKNSRIQNSILTPRLILNNLTLDDCDFILSIVNSKGWIENIGDRHVYSKKEAMEYINKILRTENFMYWVVKTRDTNTSIGIISLIKRNYLDHFDIGFAFLPEYNHYGYAYEAAKSVLTMVSTLPAFKTMLATTLPSNTSSIKLLTKLGFRFEKENETESTQMHIYTNAPL